VRIALIANAASGGGLDIEPLADRMRRHGADLRTAGYTPEGLETAAGWDDVDRVVVAGGDGTVGTVAELAGRLNVPLAVIPTGTANDFARANDLPRDPEAAAELAATGGELRAMELARLADGRPFVNVASAGLASAAARKADPLKSVLGPLAYPIGALRAAATEKPLRCRVCAAGDEVFDGEAWQAIVAVTGAFGGGAEVGAADPEDGELDAAILPAGSRLGLARRAWGLRRGTIAEQHDVRHARGTVVEVELPPGTEFNVDGEVHDTGMERITVEHRAYRLVVA
jgi:diacylglycerol kinase family enzyme